MQQRKIWLYIVAGVVILSVLAVLFPELMLR